MVVSSSRRYLGVHSFYLLFFVIGCRGKAKWFKTAGVYSILFKIPALREEIEDLWILIVLTVIIHPPGHFLERVERR